MKDGTYKVVKFINTRTCGEGHLKIAEGTWIEVSGNSAIVANSVKFPARILNTVQDCLVKIR